MSQLIRDKIFIFALMYLVLPIQYVFAATGSGKQGLIACTGVDCSFNDLLTTFFNLIREGIKIAVAFVAIVFVMAGWIYMTSGGDSGKISNAHDMFRKGTIGFLVVLSAFLIVELLVRTLGLDPNIIKLVP